MSRAAAIFKKCEGGEGNFAPPPSKDELIFSFLRPLPRNSEYPGHPPPPQKKKWKMKIEYPSK